jgi:hypothetical protein
MQASVNNPINIVNAIFHLFNAQEVSIDGNPPILKHQKTISNSVTTQRESRKSTLVALVIFLGSATESEFQIIFGESLGSHLWTKFYINSKYNF